MADFHLWATYAIILATVAAYVSERFTLEIVALGSLVAFLALFAFIPYEASGGLPPEELLSGFANPALATVLALLIVGQGLFATDALDKPARILANSAGSSSTRTIIITLITAAMDALEHWQFFFVHVIYPTFLPVLRSGNCGGIVRGRRCPRWRIR